MSNTSQDVPTIVIPYRNRRAHLNCLIVRLAEFPIIVVEQCDDHPFNRGALLNAGYVKAREHGARRVILHDCDLIPDDTLLGMYREQWPLPIVHFGARFRRYNNSRTYFGGVHGFCAGSFPGFPNHFWGWGGEDDALRKRVDLHDTTYARHGEYVDLEGFPTARDKLRHLHARDKCQDKSEKLRSDCVDADNHRVGTLQCETAWRQLSDKLKWGCINFHREG